RERSAGRLPPPRRPPCQAAPARTAHAGGRQARMPKEGPQSPGEKRQRTLGRSWEPRGCGPKSTIGLLLLRSTARERPPQSLQVQLQLRPLLHPSRLARSPPSGLPPLPKRELPTPLPRRAIPSPQKERSPPTGQTRRRPTHRAEIGHPYRRRSEEHTS